MKLSNQQKKEERQRLALTFVVILGLVGIMYWMNGLWPFGENSVVTGDLGGQYINYFSAYRRAILSGSSFTYMFTKSLGGNVLGIFAYYVSSPFNILYLFFKPQFYLQLANVILALKIACAGTAFTFFIGRHWKLRGWSIPLGCCYGFCAYNIAYAQNIMWHDGVILLPLVCYGIDLLIQNKRPFVYFSWLALAIFANFYIAYMLCIFSVLYFGIQMLSTTREQRQALGGTASFWKSRCLSFAIGSLCAGMTCGVFLLPSLGDIQKSKGIGNYFSFTLEKLFPMREFAQQMWPGNFAWENVENGLPQIYCGLFAVVLALAFFICKRISLRQKLLYGGLVLVLVLSFQLEGLNLIWHGLSEPVWFPHRFSFVFSFVILLLAGGTLAKASYTKTEIFATLLLFFGLSVWTFFVRYCQLTLTKIVLAGAGVLLTLLLLYLSRTVFSATRKKVLGVSILAALLIVGEVTMTAAAMTDQFEKYGVTEYRDFVKKQTETIHTIHEADAGNYRMEKTFGRSFNDPMLLQFYGISHFGSTMDNHAAALLADLQLAGLYPHAYGSMPTADALVGLKYMIGSEEKVPPIHYHKTDLQTPYPVYENVDALPMVFLSHAGTKEIYKSTDSVFEKQNRIYSDLQGKETQLYTEMPFVLKMPQGEVTTVPNAIEDETLCQFTAQKTGPYYIHMEINDPYPICLTTEDSTVEIPNPNFCGVVYLGDFQQGETVSFTIHVNPTELKTMCIASLDAELFHRTAAALQQQEAEVQMEDAKVTISVTAEEPAMIFTSIPFDSNWEVMLDGNAAEMEPLINGHLVGVSVEPGSHTVVLKYPMPSIGGGLIFTCLGIAGIVSFFLLMKKQNQKAKQTV